MARPQKYLFDVSFDAPEQPFPAGKPPEPVFTRADLEAARDEAAAQGRAAALAEAACARDERTTAALEALGRDIGALIAARAALAREAEDQAVSVLRAVLQKTVPALCRKDPLAEIEALVAGCLADVADEPRLVLRVNDKLFDAVQARLAAIVQAGGYAGKIVLLADEALADGDGRVEWADGGAERDTRRIAQDIDAVLARALAAPAPTTCPLEETRHGRDPEPAAH
jgi:flagellar assembly protein FliH